jgi:hypothetical protein
MSNFIIIEEGNNILPPNYPIQTIRNKMPQNNRIVAIVLAEIWFDTFFNEGSMPYFVTPNDHVVCQWFDFTVRFASYYPETKETIAICRNELDALEIFNRAN